MDQTVQLEKCIAVAKQAGCPKDQVKRFLESGYIPLPWQWDFHSEARHADFRCSVHILNPEDKRTDCDCGPVDLGLGGARGPGKSHAVLSQSALDDCQRVEKLKGLFLRQTATASKESFDDLIDKVVVGRVVFERANNILKFENGSRIIFGGFKDEKDIDKYIGIEYDFIIVEELNQLSEEKYTKLRGSLRTSKPNWRPRMYTSFNPGGIGHGFIKNRYINPLRSGTQKKTRFIGSTYKSNPYLNTEYVSYLEELQGDLGKAWREGDWDLFAGQYFSEWKYDLHVVKPFSDGIPDHWVKLRSIDPSGRSGVTSCHWYALSSDGDVYVYREYYATGRDHDEHAKEIAKLSEGETYPYTCIDGAAFSKLGLPETTAEVYERHGVQGLIPSMKNRVMGWNTVHQYLRWKDKDDTGYPLPPKLKVFSTCPHLIRNIPLAIHDEKHPEDIKSYMTKIQIEQNGILVEGNEHQDCLDELRYLLQTLREQVSPRSQSIVEKRIEELRKKEREQSFNYNYSRRVG